MWRVREINAYDLFYGAMWKGRVQPVQCGCEAALQDALCHVTTFARIVDLHAALGRYAQGGEINRGNIFDELFGG